MRLDDYLWAAPKAELHVHLEGAIQPATLLALARRNNVALPVTTLDEARTWMTYHDFESFCRVFMTCARCLRSAADYERVAYECGAALARQNIQYAEVTFSPCMHRYDHGVVQEMYFSGLTAGRARAHAEFGITLNWVFDIVRDIVDPIERRRRADYTVAVAIEGKADGVVALGLGGAEEGYPPEQFAPWFERARAAGLHSTPHAGEGAGPKSIWGAVHALGAERIGHGVRAIEDPTLVAYLAEQGIALEVCPTSNVRLGIYRDYADHPLARLHAAGVPITVNSDDPCLFGATLTDEVALLDTRFGLDVTGIDEIMLNGVRHSFLPAAQKRTLEAAWRGEMARLRNPQEIGNGDYGLEDESAES